MRKQIVLVLRRLPVAELPPSDPSRDMTNFMRVDWGQAVSVALDSLTTGRPIPADVPRGAARAAESFWRHPIKVVRDPGEPAQLRNGHHRVEAMRKQGVMEAIAREERPKRARPLPGELKQVGVG